MSGPTSDAHDTAPLEVIDHTTPPVDPAPGAPLPGADPSFAGALRLAASRLPFRLLGVLGAVLAFSLVVALRPVTVETIDSAGVQRQSECGINYHLFGGPVDIVTQACRDAYAPRAIGGALILVALIAVAALLFANVQYWRGHALGRVWESPARWRELITSGSAVVAATIVVAMAVGSTARSVVVESASAADLTSPSMTGGFTRDETVVPGPDFDTESEIAVRDLQSTRSNRSSASPTTVPTPTTTARAVVASPTTTTTTSTTTPAPTPLSVTATAWYTARSNPLDTVTIPEGTLPVGVFNGADDKHSFFRVTGSDAALVLGQDGSVGATRSADAADVQACPVIVAGWEPVEGGSMDEEPLFATTGCVAVEPLGNGTWRIDLSTFPERGGDRGFALVPASTDANWQVTFTPPAR